MPGMWQVIRSILAGKAPSRMVSPSRISVVALAVGEQDRCILRTISAQKPVDMHFAESSEEALALANQWIAPVILFDRDWPKTDWRVVVERLAATPHGACVILMSGVAGTDSAWWVRRTCEAASDG